MGAGILRAGRCCSALGADPAADPPGRPDTSIPGRGAPLPPALLARGGRGSSLLSPGGVLLALCSVGAAC